MFIHTSYLILTKTICGSDFYYFCLKYGEIDTKRLNDLPKAVQLMNAYKDRLFNGRNILVTRAVIVCVIGKVTLFFSQSCSKPITAPPVLQSSWKWKRPLSLGQGKSERVQATICFLMILFSYTSCQLQCFTLSSDSPRCTY